MEKLQKKLVIKENSTKNILLTDIDNTEIYLNKNTVLNLAIVTKKGSIEPKNINFTLEENSHLNFLTIILGKKNNKFLFTTTANHISKNTTSNCIIKSAIFDESIVDYKGKIKITDEGENTVSHLTHKSLMFSENAKVNTLPSLEIEADSVKAGHSASVGKMDEEMLFYLQSRGLNTNSAKNLLLRSFLEEDIEQFNDKNLLQLIKKELII